MAQSAEQEEKVLPPASPHASAPCRCPLSGGCAREALRPALPDDSVLGFLNSNGAPTVSAKQRRSAVRIARAHQTNCSASQRARATFALTPPSDGPMTITAMRSRAVRHSACRCAHAREKVSPALRSPPAYRTRSRAMCRANSRSRAGMRGGGVYPASRHPGGGRRPWALANAKCSGGAPASAAPKAPDTSAEGRTWAASSAR